MIVIDKPGQDPTVMVSGLGLQGGIDAETLRGTRAHAAHSWSLEGAEGRRKPTRLAADRNCCSDCWISLKSRSQRANAFAPLSLRRSSSPRSPSHRHCTLRVSVSRQAWLDSAGVGGQMCRTFCGDIGPGLLSPDVGA